MLACPESNPQNAQALRHGGLRGSGHGVQDSEDIADHQAENRQAQEKRLPIACGAQGCQAWPLQDL